MAFLLSPCVHIPQIEIFRPLMSSRSTHLPSREHEGFYSHASYTYHDLPARYWKKYQYASQFVQLVRSKTPKVTLYSDQAKCMLMENAPNPDFEACFYSGELLPQLYSGTILIHTYIHTYLLSNNQQTVVQSRREEGKKIRFWKGKSNQLYQEPGYEANPRFQFLLHVL